MTQSVSPVRRPGPESGIAIGVILFAIAIIAVVAVAMTSGGNFLGTTLSIDRVSAEVKSQADLIRNKIGECYRNGVENRDLYCSNNTYVSSMGNWTRADQCGTPPYDPSDATSHIPTDLSDLYPVSTGNGTAVSALDCPGYGAGAQNLWTGQVGAFLPVPPNGFDPWVYVNAGATGGRCIRIQPVAANATDPGIRAGLAEAARAFSASELVYGAASSSQRFIIWITPPGGTPSADCQS